MLLFLFLAVRIPAEHPVHLLLIEQQLAHLVTRTPVDGIRCLFLSQQLGVFLLQALNGRELFHAQIVKDVLRRLVQRRFAHPVPLHQLPGRRTVFVLRHHLFLGLLSIFGFLLLLFFLYFTSCPIFCGSF